MTSQQVIDTLAQLTPANSLASPEACEAIRNLMSKDGFAPVTNRMEPGDLLTWAAQNARDLDRDMSPPIKMGKDSPQLEEKWSW